MSEDLLALLLFIAIMVLYTSYSSKGFTEKANWGEGCFIAIFGIGALGLILIVVRNVSGVNEIGNFLSSPSFSAEYSVKYRFSEQGSENYTTAKLLVNDDENSCPISLYEFVFDGEKVELSEEDCFYGLNEWVTTSMIVHHPIEVMILKNKTVKYRFSNKGEIFNAILGDYYRENDDGCPMYVSYLEKGEDIILLDDDNCFPKINTWVETQMQDYEPIEIMILDDKIRDL